MTEADRGKGACHTQEVSFSDFFEKYKDYLSKTNKMSYLETKSAVASEQQLSSVWHLTLGHVLR